MIKAIQVFLGNDLMGKSHSSFNFMQIKFALFAFKNSCHFII